MKDCLKRIASQLDSRDAEIKRLREWLQHMSDWGYDWMEGADSEAFTIYETVYGMGKRAIDGEAFPAEWRKG